MSSVQASQGRRHGLYRDFRDFVSVPCARRFNAYLRIVGLIGSAETNRSGFPPRRFRLPPYSDLSASAGKIAIAWRQNSLHGASNAGETDVKRGTRASSAALNAQKRPLPSASSLPNLLNSTRSHPAAMS